MGKSVKLSSNSSDKDFRIVKPLENVHDDKPLIFTFSNFKMSPISIDGFNNYYCNEEEYIRKISIILGKALPLLSNENTNIFTDKAKMKTLHLHLLNGKEDILRRIFKTYQFKDEIINNFIEGAEIYQIEVPYENGASRIIFERIENLISFLFLDPNHHIYLDRKIVDDNGSLFYDYCPINLEGDCERLDYLHTCFAFDYLDIDKYHSTFGYKFSP
jgi:hypothetical protein